MFYSKVLKNKYPDTFKFEGLASIYLGSRGKKSCFKKYKIYFNINKNWFRPVSRLLKELVLKLGLLIPVKESFTQNQANKCK